MTTKKVAKINNKEPESRMRSTRVFPKFLAEEKCLFLFLIIIYSIITCCLYNVTKKFYDKFIYTYKITCSII